MTQLFSRETVMYKVFLVSILLLAGITFAGEARETVEFPSVDGLTITADYYPLKEAPLILLFHQAGWSRGEYREIAPKLNDMGFACLAIDQRSGGEVNGVVNATHKRALDKGLPTAYLDAVQDMQAALNYALTTLGYNKVIVWGSSYSSALSFVLSANNMDKVSAMLAFAPGEYFSRFGKSDHFIADHARKLKMPVFITSARKEHKNWKDIFSVIPSKDKKSFLPATAGQHGSRALWEKFPEHKAYWAAVTAFLQKLK